MASAGSRAGLFRPALRLLTRRHNQAFVRKAGGGGPHIVAQYRQPPHVTNNQKFQAELLSGAMWFWILWHTWHDPDAILGHFTCPDPSAWTDEELGIPPDDE
ncbi:NADH dehydrogenase [ubiquinone] 1 beta subcomplex subunit 2, mitochondrial [Brachyhypopomus gauderio]|uniref:NADH dehydrogenase [ubiquinone] 1 beta subcomplex subunit 2, mitochondrial n=1 Tax=Brachyhypopomus gauderio TaxID=698409 RepID=UPI004042572A